MSENNKHIYSKEELLKIMKEGKNIPADLDDFDKEALEGLNLLADTSIVNKLDAEVDTIIEEDKKRTSKKIRFYFLSAAASVLLLIGFFFLFNHFSTKNESVALAENKNRLKEEETKPAFDSISSHQLQKNNQTQQIAALSEPKIDSKKINAPSLPPAPTTKDELNWEDGGANSKGTVAKTEVTQSPETVIHNRMGSSSPQVAAKKQEADDVASNDVAIIDADTKSGGTIEREEYKKEAFQQAANKDVSAVVPTQSGIVMADEKKHKSKTSANLFSASKADLQTNKYQEPDFIGGNNAFISYVKQNLKISSPQNSGVMVVEFLVEKNGSAKKIKIAKSLAGCDACDKDVINLIKLVPRWQPAIMNGDTTAAPKKLSIQYN